MTQRIAPPGGYAAGIKNQYRRNVWATFERACDVPMSEARVFILPSSEGVEIEVALSKGVRESNIDICDKNVAIAASLKRKYPRVTAHGITVERVFQERHQRTYDLINLDLCGIADSAGRAAFWAGLRLRPGGVAAVTWTKGRDRGFSDDGESRQWHVTHRLWAGHQLATLSGFPVRIGCPDPPVDLMRKLMAPGAGRRALRKLRNETYVLHRTPMEWAAWKSCADPRPLEDDVLAWAWQVSAATICECERRAGVA